MDYFSVDVEFSAAVDPSILGSLSNYSISPLRPAGLAILSAAVDSEKPARVRLTFNKPLLSFRYTVSVPKIEEESGSALRASQAEFIGKGLVAFVTQGSGSGNLALWADAKDASGYPLSGIQGADQVCKAEADRAGLAGTFKAFVSTSFINARDRLPPASGPYFTTHDDFLVESFGDFVNPAKGSRVPLVYDAEENSCQAFGCYAATGSDITGAKTGDNCNDFQDAAETNSMSFGFAQASGGMAISSYSPMGCNDGFRLYCFQEGEESEAPDLRATGKIVFLSSAKGTGDLSSWKDEEGNSLTDGKTKIEAADRVCRNLARNAGFSNPDRFVALISDSTTDGRSRLSPSPGPWVLPNGVKVAEDFADLIDGALLTSIYLDEKGGRDPTVAVTTPQVWTGGAEGLQTNVYCGDWTDGSTGTGTVGSPWFSARGWWLETWNLNCNWEQRLYCFEL